MAEPRLVLRHRGRDHVVQVLGDGRLEVDGTIVHARSEPDGVVRYEDPGGSPAWTASEGDVRWVFLDGRTYRFEVQQASPRRRTAGHHESLTAPMPATVRHIAVSAGDEVKRGDVILILEAMKMELPLRAPADGLIEAIHCREGALVQPGVALVDIDEH